MSPLVRTITLAGLAASVLTFGACAPDAPAQRKAWPAGTVLALNDTPIDSAEVDEIGSIVARIDERSTLPYLRRIALTNVILPRIAAAQLSGAEGRDAARTSAEASRAALAQGQEPPAEFATPNVATIEGGVHELGLEVWNWALDCPIETWSEPIETVGAWRLARVIERSAGLRPGDVDLEVEVRLFPWSDSPTFVQDLDAHLDQSQLTFVDESWRDLVPTMWQRRLRGSP